MNYSSENILVEIFSAQSKRFYTQVTGQKLSRHYLLKEFNSGYGVADLVFGTFVPYLSKRSLRDTIDSNWAAVLIDMQQKCPVTIEEFSQTYSISSRTASAKLKQFVSAGFLKSSREGFSKHKDYKEVVGTSIAVEAKLKNWKQALNQARRYQRFANYSFVLLDKGHSTPAESNLEVFKRFNIGLATLNGDKVEIHYSPHVSHTNHNDYFYKLNEAVYDYFKSVYGGSEGLYSM